MGQMLQRKGFTLGEALITIGIIGVISALTIPALMRGTSEAESVAKVKKIYNTLTNAFEQAQFENDGLPPASWATSQTNSILDIMANHMKVLRSYPTSNVLFGTQKCDGTTDNYCFWQTDSKSYLLPDGIVISRGCLPSEGTCTAYANYIAVDINGSKKPNKHGLDAFLFEITDKGIEFPTPIGATPTDNCLSTAALDGGLYCASWVVFNDNMDYNKCPEKLSWTTTQSCRAANTN